MFVSSTGTGAGKTHFSRGLAAAFRARGVRVAALKPFETGCDPEPLDALALELAAGTSGFARDAQFYRARSPVSPWAAAIEGEPPPRLELIQHRIREISRAHELTIVEGAGGLLVPVSPKSDMASFGAELGYPVLIAAPNRLGVLSHVRAIHAAALARSLRVLAIVLTEPDREPDASSTTNAQILRELLPSPILAFAHSADRNEDLARAAELSGVIALLGW